MTVAAFSYHLPSTDTLRAGRWLMYGPTAPEMRYDSYPAFEFVPGSRGDAEPTRYGDFKIDLDSKDDVMQAVREALLVVKHFESVYDIAPEAWRLYLSGSKGVHLILPAEVLGMEEGQRLLPLIYKRLALALAGNAGLKTLDPSLYCMGSGRPFRLPNKQRENGLYKVPLSFDGLCKISDAEDYKKLCSAPRPDPSKVVLARSEALTFKVQSFTAEAEEAARLHKKPSITTTGTPGKYGQAALASELSKVARASEGERNDTLNRAAFSLGQLVTGGELNRGPVEAALIGTALSIGLSEAEARATIRSGFEAGAREPRTAPESGRRESLLTGEWPEPLPLTAKIDPLPYPTDALPETIRAAVEEVRDFVQAPISMIAGSALAAVSLASQALVDVERASKLTGPCSLNFLTIAESGERKTSTDGYSFTAIRNHEIEQAELAKPTLKKYEADASLWGSKRAGLLDAVKTATKNGNSCEGLELKLHELQADEPLPPKIPRLVYHDATQEALVKGLTGWPSGGVISSEAGAVFGSHGMSSDSLMRNLSTYNILWDGGTLRFDRRGEGGSFTLRGARLTVSLQVQEPTLKAFLEKSGELARGTGFLARSLVAWPESTQGTRFFKEAPAHWPALATFHSRITKLLNIPAPIAEDGAFEPKMLTLSPEAKEAWILFHDTIERALSCGGELTDVKDVASKAADNAARMAALFHVFEHGIAGAIEAGHVEAAGRIVAWHLNEARRFFGELAISSEAGNVARLDAWLLEYCRVKRTKIIQNVDVQQYGPNPLRSKEALESALSELIYLGRVRLLKDGKRKSIHINPALLRGQI